jgi:hypothetical protein
MSNSHLHPAKEKCYLLTELRPCGWLWRVLSWEWPCNTLVANVYCETRSQTAYLVVKRQWHRTNNSLEGSWIIVMGTRFMIRNPSLIWCIRRKVNCWIIMRAKWNNMCGVLPNTEMTTLLYSSLFSACLAQGMTHSRHTINMWEFIEWVSTWHKACNIYGSQASKLLTLS